MKSREIQSAIQELNDYVTQRKKEKMPYHSFWGSITRMSAEVKINAANKMIALLQGKSITPLNSLEISALRDGRLGKSIHKFEINKLLPSVFIKAENAKMMRVWRYMR